MDVKGKKIWDSVESYNIIDRFPCGHGEKSVIILQQFIRLNVEEIMAIRWHMAGFDDSSKQYSGAQSLTLAMNEFPLVTLLHMADLSSIYIQERKPDPRTANLTASVDCMGENAR